MVKKQKVKFHRGDQRPHTPDRNLSYRKKMVKKGTSIVWHVVEQPTNNVVGKYFFEDDANVLADFQNKHKVWQVNGGIPRFLWNYMAGSYN